MTTRFRSSKGNYRDKKHHRAWRVECCLCKATKIVDCPRPGVNAPEEVVLREYERCGWYIASHSSSDRCPHHAPAKGEAPPLIGTRRQRSAAAYAMSPPASAEPVPEPAPPVPEPRPAELMLASVRTAAEPAPPVPEPPEPMPTEPVPAPAPVETPTQVGRQRARRLEELISSIRAAALVGSDTRDLIESVGCEVFQLRADLKSMSESLKQILARLDAPAPPRAAPQASSPKTTPTQEDADTELLNRRMMKRLQEQLKRA